MEKEIIFEVVLKIMKLRTNDDGMCVSLFCFVFYLWLHLKGETSILKLILYFRFTCSADQNCEQLNENEIQTLSYIHTSYLKLYYATFCECQVKFPITPLYPTT